VTEPVAPDPPTAEPMTTTIGLAALRELAPGTGRVQSVMVGTQGTLLKLGYPNGLHVLVAIPEVPQRVPQGDCSLGAMRPLAVRMSNSRRRSTAASWARRGLDRGGSGSALLKPSRCVRPASTPCSAPSEGSAHGRLKLHAVHEFTG